jgi:hypothetical protein
MIQVYRYIKLKCYYFFIPVEENGKLRLVDILGGLGFIFNGYLSIDFMESHRNSTLDVTLGKFHVLKINLNDNSPIDLKEFQQFFVDSKMIPTFKTTFTINSSKNKSYDFDVIEIESGVINSFLKLVRQNKFETKYIENKKYLLNNFRSPQFGSFNRSLLLGGSICDYWKHLK